MTEQESNIGLESPADLRWSQGAKNPRININILGTPKGETATAAGLKNGPPTDESELYGTPIGETMPPKSVADLERKALFPSYGTPSDETSTTIKGTLQNDKTTIVVSRDKEVERKEVFTANNRLERSPPVMKDTSTNTKKNEDPWIVENINTSPTLKLMADETEHERKRKRLETPPKKSNNTDSMSELNKALAKVVKRANELKKLVNDSPKTKVEIKQVARELNHLVDNLQSKMKKYQDDHVCSVITDRAEKTDKETQTDPAISRSDISIQVNPGDPELEKQRIQSILIGKINKVLETDLGFQAVSNLLDDVWPDVIYKKTQFAPWNVSNLNSDGDFAILFDPGDTTENKIVDNLNLKFPDMKDIITKNEGQIDYLVSTVATRTKKQESTEKTTALYILPFKIDKEGLNNMEEAYNTFKALKDSMHVHPTKKLNLILSDGLNQDYIRKLSEYVFSNSEVNIILMNPSGIPKTLRNNKMRPQTERVLVKSGTTTYADLLKTVKNEVNIKEVGVQVKSIKKTTRGDLLLEVEGDKQKAGALREAIREKVKNDVRVSNRDVIIHVLDIDAATSQEQVEEAIKDELGPNDDHSLLIRSMRPTRDGNQIATAQVSRHIANLLVKAQKIQIGWIKCRIRERIPVPRCYRCLEFGHRKFECKGPDRSNICIKCNKPGHKALECKDTPYCPTCRSTEHRADTTKCPRFRQLIQTHRRPNRERVGSSYKNDELH